MSTHIRRVVTSSAVAAAFALWRRRPSRRRPHGRPGARPRPPALSGGNGTLYIGTYKGEIEIFDEATEKLVGTIKLKTGIPRSLTPSPDRTRFYALDSRFEKIEIIDIATRKTIDTFKLTQRQQEHPRPQPAARSAQQVPDPADRTRHQADRPLGDRPDDAAAVRPRQHQFSARIPWPQRRGARDRQHALLARRQAPLPLRRRRLVLETEKFTEVETWPLSASRPKPAWAASTSARCTTSTTGPALHRPLHDGRTRCRARRIMGIGRVDLTASKLDFQPLGPARTCRRSRRRRTASAATASRRTSATTSSGPSTSRRTTVLSAPSSRAGRAWACASARTASCSTSTWPAPRSTSTRRPRYKYLRTIQLGGDQTTELFVFPARQPATPLPRRADAGGGTMRVPQVTTIVTPRRPTPTCVGRSRFWPRPGAACRWCMAISLVSTGAVARLALPLEGSGRPGAGRARPGGAVAHRRAVRRARRRSASC